MNADTSPSPGRRRWPWIVGIATAVVLFGIWHVRLTLVEWILVAAIESRGYESVTLTVAYADLSRLELHDVHVGGTPGLSADRLVARYTVDDLQLGRVRAVDLDRPRFSAAWDGEILTINGLGSFGPFDAPAESEHRDRFLDLPPLPFSRLKMVDLAVNLTLPEGTLLVAGDLAGERGPHGDVSLAGTPALTALLHGATVRARAAVDARMAADGTLRGRATLEEAEYTGPDYAVAGIVGDLHATHSPDGSLEAAASLAYEAASHGDAALAAGTLDASASLPADGATPGRIDLRLDHGGLIGPDLTLGAGAVVLGVQGNLVGPQRVAAILDTNRLEIPNAVVDAALLSVEIDLESLRPQGLQARLMHRGLQVAGIEDAPGVMQFSLRQRSQQTEAALAWGWGRLAATASDLRLDTLDQPTALQIEGRIEATRLQQFWPAAVQDLGAIAFDLDGILERPLDLLDLRLDLALQPGSYLAAERLRLATGAALPEMITLTLAGDGNRTQYDARSGRWSYRLAAESVEGPLHLPDTLGVAHIATGAVESVGSSENGISLTLRGATARLPSRDLALSGVTVALLSQGMRTELALQAGRLRHTAKTPLFAPIDLRGRAATADNDRIDFNLSLNRPAEAMTARIVGRHRLDTGRGEATLTSEPVEFRPDTLQPHDLFPAMAGLIDQIEGRVALEGVYRWGAAGLDATQTITLDSLNVDFPQGRLTALTGRVQVDGLERPSTPPHQRLTAIIQVQGMEAMPLDLTFQMHAPERMTVERFAVDVAGGQLIASDVAFDLAALPVGAEPRRIGFDLDVERIDLSHLFRLIGVDGLDGTGHISGRIPVTLVGGQVTIQRGRLAAEGAGRLGYSGTELADALTAREDVVSLAMEALTDFRYEEMSLELTKQPTGEGEVMLRMSGANPQTLDGHPFRFNIRFMSDFDRLAEFVLLGADVSSTLLRWAAGRPAQP